MINIKSLKNMSACGRVVVAVSVCFGVALPVTAGILDFTRSTTEAKDMYLIYDLPGFSSPLERLKDKVKEALIYRGDNALVTEALMTGDLPKVPKKLQLKPVSFGPYSVTVPSCPGAAFVVSSSDASGASYGETARYMACAFPYAAGYRVNFFASYKAENGGMLGLSKTLAKAVVGAVGLNTSPQAFIKTSIAKMEELFKESGWVFQIVEMSPAISGKNLVEDPLLIQQAAEAKRGGDRVKRMAARAELAKLSIDASDRARLTKAIQNQDEDIVALFVEAGAMDFAARDEFGKQLGDYATSPSIKGLLP